MAKKTEIIQIIILVTALLMMLTGNIVAILASFGTIIVVAILYNRSVLFRIGKLKFWIISAGIVLLAGMFLGKNPESVLGVAISIEGIIAGCTMTLRAFSIILALSMLAQNIKRDRILQLTGKLGLPHFAPAFETAVETLPYLKQAYSEKETVEKSRFQSLINVLLFADILARRQIAENVTVFAITGKRSQGKTEFILKLHKYCHDNNISVGGFVQKRYFAENQNPAGYNVTALNSNESVKIAEKNAEPQTGHKFFSTAFAQSAGWLRAESAKCQLMLVDELGILEAKGLGHAPAIKYCLEKFPSKIWVVTLRKDKRNQIMKLFDIAPANIFDLDEIAVNTDEIQNNILQALQNISSEHSL